MKHEDWMRLALKQAETALEKDEVPIGAVIVKNGEILALAHNEKETNQDPTAHAEMLAIKRAAQKLGAWRLSGATLYVTLEPCPMCAGAIIQSRIETLVYGADDSKGGAVGSVLNVLQHQLWNHKVEIITGILEEESARLLKGFFRSKR
ncbi:tRNA-adenosine deaminase [Syntrophobotulus glycolicus DSM 8271]|uniref:tRNA-specific adenosine deaminase n=1 Tax=Syntrophobotulus glycolicus (strain DSM 8271 / FlGlyR) TaxID=645991 RepID=F0SUH8_SYNGF|nr:tRNA adenosine(34) deaminase TadA [Syntrophobotulus glycolicus]ADY54391.1 tRNA-adenosine deaminase [Syntrophobotulus glycolicus DSM 8271]